jgi:hypothetical protein
MTRSLRPRSTRILTLTNWSPGGPTGCRSLERTFPRYCCERLGSSDLRLTSCSKMCRGPNRAVHVATRARQTQLASQHEPGYTGTQHRVAVRPAQAGSRPRALQTGLQSTASDSQTFSRPPSEAPPPPRPVRTRRLACAQRNAGAVDFDKLSLSFTARQARCETTTIG